MSLAALEACREVFVAQGLCRKDCNRRTQLIREFFRWAGGRHKGLDSIWAHLGVVEPLEVERTEAPECEEVAPVPDDVVAKTLPHLPLVVQAMLRVQWFSGMRPGEVCIMRGADIDRSGAVWL